MGMEVMSLLPTAAPAQANGGSSAPSGTSSNNGGQDNAFGGLLASLSITPKAANQAATMGASGAQAPSQASAKDQLQQMLSSLAGAKVDLKAPGLGLTPVQLQQLLAKLQKVLQDGSQDDGAELLASMLAASQMAGIQPQDLAGLTQLLGTSAEGTVSDAALGSNLHLLVQAIQLMADTGGQTTLLQAVQELTPPADAFTQQLAAVLAEPDTLVPQAGAQYAPDTGPPEGESPGEADSQASATAGSNGRESTVTPTGATSPADGAAEEAPDVKTLAQALEDLLQGHQQTQSGAQPAAATGQASAPANQPASQPALAAQLAQMAPTQPATVTTKAGTAAVQQATKDAVSPAGEGDAKPLALDASAGSALPAVAPQATGHDQAPSQHDGQPPQQAGSGTGQAQPQLALAAQPAPTAFANSLDTAQLATGPTPAAPPAIEQSVLDQVVQNATLALRNGEQEFRIQLKPDFLGVMEVRVSVDSGTVSVRMSVESAATRQLIDNNIGQLKQAFGTDQIRVEHVPSFANSDATASFGQGNPQGFWQGQNPQAGWSPLPEAIPYSGDGEAQAVQDAGAATPQEPATGASSGSTLVDLKA